MDFARQQRNPARHLLGISFVAVFHVVPVYALVNGLGHKLVEVIKKPYETKLIEEAPRLKILALLLRGRRLAALFMLLA